MVTDTAENPAEKADFVTTMGHIVAITKRDDVLTTLRTVVDELDECAERIHRSIMSYEIPSRADLERITDLQCAFEDAADDVKTYCNGASTAADLLTGRLRREPNGDVTEVQNSSEDAVSEAIV